MSTVPKNKRWRPETKNQNCQPRGSAVVFTGQSRVLSGSRATPYLTLDLLTHMSTYYVPKIVPGIGLHFFFYKFIYLFLFLAALGLRCGTQASHCGGFSYCRARALGTWASAVVAHGL